MRMERFSNETEAALQVFRSATQKTHFHVKNKKNTPAEIKEAQQNIDLQLK